MIVYKRIKMVNLKNGKQMWNVNWSTWHERGTENNQSPWQESSPWPSKQWVGALSTELGELIDSKSFIWVLMWQASCILLGSRLSKSLSVVSEKRWLIFSFVKKCEKSTDQHNMSVGKIKNQSPRQESSPWPPEHQACTLSTEPWDLS